MGKKRRFKRGDDKKGSGSGFLPGFQQPPPGIVIPGETVYIDRRADGDFVAPTPPVELTPEEIELEKVTREWMARKAARKAEEEAAAAANASATGIGPGGSSASSEVIDLPQVVLPKPDLSDPIPATRELPEDLPAVIQADVPTDGTGGVPADVPTDGTGGVPSDGSASENSESVETLKEARSPEEGKAPEYAKMENANTPEDSEPSAENNEPSANNDDGEVPPPAATGVTKRKSIAELLEEAETDVEMEATRLQLLASAWRARDKVYNQLFGKPAYVTPASYREPSTVVPPDFGKKRKDTTGADTGNPGDPTNEEQHLAVLAYGPDPQSPYWKYVTAGLASPWVQYEPLQVSGFGCELMIKSPVDAPWAAQFLRTLAFYVFNHAGVLSQGVRLRLNSPIDPASNSELRNAFVWYADEAPDTLYELPSGLFSILLVCGITDEELKFADSIEEYGTWCIQALLRQAGHHQVTDPKRECSTRKANINEMKMSVRNFAETFRANKEGRFTADDTGFYQ